MTAVERSNGEMDREPSLEVDEDEESDRPRKMSLSSLLICLTRILCFGFLMSITSTSATIGVEAVFDLSLVGPLADIEPVCFFDLFRGDVGSGVDVDADTDGLDVVGAAVAEEDDDDEEDEEDDDEDGEGGEDELGEAGEEVEEAEDGVRGARGEGGRGGGAAEGETITSSSRREEPFATTTSSTFDFLRVWPFFLAILARSFVSVRGSGECGERLCVGAVGRRSSGKEKAKQRVG